MRNNLWHRIEVFVLLWSPEFGSECSTLCAAESMPWRSASTVAKTLLSYCTFSEQQWRSKCQVDLCATDQVEFLNQVRFTGRIVHSHESMPTDLAPSYTSPHVQSSLAFANQRDAHIFAAFETGLGGILSFIFERRDDFAEVLEFVQAMNTQYDLQVRKMHGDFKAGIVQLTTVSGIRAIFLGTRRSGIQSGRFIVCLSLS